MRRASLRSSLAQLVGLVLAAPLTETPVAEFDTDMNTRQRQKTPELIDKLTRGIPLRRIGTPQEVAHAMVYLASEESVYVTGSELAIDGGATA